MLFKRKDKKPEWLRDLGRLQLEPGDVIVVRLAPGSGWMLEAEIDRMVKQIEAKTGHSVIVFNGPIEIGAVSK